MRHTAKNEYIKTRSEMTIVPASVQSMVSNLKGKQKVSCSNLGYSSNSILKKKTDSKSTPKRSVQTSIDMRENKTNKVQKSKIPRTVKESSSSSEEQNFSTEIKDHSLNLMDQNNDQVERAELSVASNLKENISKKSNKSIHNESNTNLKTDYTHDENRGDLGNIFYQNDNTNITFPKELSQISCLYDWDDSTVYEKPKPKYVNSYEKTSFTSETGELLSNYGKPNNAIANHMDPKLQFESQQKQQQTCHQDHQRQQKEQKFQQFQQQKQPPFDSSQHTTCKTDCNTKTHSLREEMDEKCRREMQYRAQLKIQMEENQRRKQSSCNGNRNSTVDSLVHRQKDDTFQHKQSWKNNHDRFLPNSKPACTRISGIQSLISSTSNGKNRNSILSSSSSSTIPSNSSPTIVDSSLDEMEFLKKYHVQKSKNKLNNCNENKDIGMGWCEESVCYNNNKSTQKKKKQEKHQNSPEQDASSSNNLVFGLNFDELSIQYANVRDERNRLRDQLVKRTNQLQRLEEQTKSLKVSQVKGHKKARVGGREEKKLGDKMTTNKNTRRKSGGILGIAPHKNVRNQF